MESRMLPIVQSENADREACVTKSVQLNTLDYYAT